MSNPEKSVRRQLLEARADIQRQIEILSAPLVNYRGGGPPNDMLIADLTATLKEIEDSLAELGADDA
jgi:hypothetical protein